MTRFRGWLALFAASLCLTACTQKIDWGDRAYPTPSEIAEAAQRVNAPRPESGRVETAKTPPIPKPRLERLSDELTRGATPEPAIDPILVRPQVVDNVALALSGPTQPIELPLKRARPEQDSAPTLLARLFASPVRAEPATEAAAAPSSEVDPQMIRAPELFSASGLAYWNGQRTVRGVWVAHPRAHGSRKVRIVNGPTGAEVDGMLYRPERSAGGDVITVSSDAALALGLEANRPVMLSLFGLRPQGSATRSQRRAVENSAFGELASHVLQMDENRLLQLVAASMRGMGYATAFDDMPLDGKLPSIRAQSGPDAEFPLPPIRAVVRSREGGRMTAQDVGELHDWLAASGDLGVVVSISGFDQDAQLGLRADAPHLEMVDLDGLLNIWLTHYESLTERDRDLLPLRPVYFLAGN